MRLGQLVDRDAPAQRLPELEGPLGRGDGARLEQLVVVERPSAASPGSPFRPERPFSSERSAFCRDSGNVRPIAIASPTLCICVPSTPVVPGNFSNAQRGTFVTT